jgi:hypothetical protein
MLAVKKRFDTVDLLIVGARQWLAPKPEEQTAKEKTRIYDYLHGGGFTGEKGFSGLANDLIDRKVVEDQLGVLASLGPTPRDVTNIIAVFEFYNLMFFSMEALVQAVEDGGHDLVHETTQYAFIFLQSLFSDKECKLISPQPDEETINQLCETLSWTGPLAVMCRYFKEWQKKELTFESAAHLQRELQGKLGAKSAHMLEGMKQDLVNRLRREDGVFNGKVEVSVARLKQMTQMGPLERLLRVVHKFEHNGKQFSTFEKFVTLATKKLATMAATPAS